MLRRLHLLSLALLAALSLSAQLVSALPADRLALANQLAKRGLHAEALKEYEAIRGEKSLPRDEVSFRLGEAYRNVGRTEDALREYAALISAYPQSRYVDYARLNRALLRDGDDWRMDYAGMEAAFADGVKTLAFPTLAAGEVRRVKDGPVVSGSCAVTLKSSDARGADARLSLVKRYLVK